MSTKVKVSGRECEISFSNDERSAGLLNDNNFDWDISQVSERVFHIIKDNHSYNVELLDSVDGTSRIKVNGTIYQAETIDKFDELLKSLGMEKGAGSKVNELKAPMPGLVLEVSVEVGSELKKGDRVMVLEAMKMENVIKSPADVTVSSIDVKKGETVEKNQVMVRFS
mgnify:CR=1 FL=1